MSKKRPRQKTKGGQNAGKGQQASREPAIEPAQEPPSSSSSSSNGDPAQEQQAIVDTTPLYSEFPIYYPNGTEAVSHETEIRLMELMPICMGKPILCNMHRFNLRKKPFIALSYTWGKYGKTETINLNGHKIPVTKNLHQALMQLRKPVDPVFLWIDALCINQNNVEERNYQVTQMPKIYSAAQEVIAWLGEGTDQSDKAMELVTLSPADLREKLKKKRDIVKRSLEDLFSRQYWTRVWVVQELASANRTRRTCTIQCGSKSVSFSEFKSFLRAILCQLDFADLKDPKRPGYLLSLSTQDDSRTFLDVLWQSSSLDATNDLDRIYGIRGISPKFYRDQIKVNYALEFQNLCRKVMTLMINKEENLNVLCYFHRYQTTPASPSWLRNFKQRNPGIPPMMYACDKGRKAKAEIKNGILRTRGVCIGSIKEKRVFNKTTRKDLSWKSGKTDLKLESELAAIDTITRKALRESRFLEMFAGGRQQVESQIGSGYHTQWQYIWKKRIAFEKGTVGSEEWKLYDASFCKIFGRLIGRAVFMAVNELPGRDAAHTEQAADIVTQQKQGNLGLGPQDMQKGDLVCVLYGCRLPVILRKDGRFYTFIGPAYVDGAMNGEFVQESNKGDRFWIQ